MTERELVIHMLAERKRNPLGMVCNVDELCISCDGFNGSSNEGTRCPMSSDIHGCYLSSVSPDIMLPAWLLADDIDKELAHEQQRSR